MQNVENIEGIIGRAVISLETANKLGKVADLLTDPLSGLLAGLSVQREDESYGLASVLDMHEIGPDAVMIDSDVALVLTEASPLNKLPRAKKDLVGVKVLTDHGQLLGAISNLYLCLGKRPVFIYEVRSSLIDKLLGREVYFAATQSCALSEDRTALVVTGNPAEMDHSVKAAAERLLGPYDVPLHQTVFDVRVRSHTE